MNPFESRASVLLVDDDEHFLKFLTDVIQDEYGHRVATATSVDEALDVLQHRKMSFDLIFLDYFMPEKNGLDLMRVMNESGLHIPVIMLTGAGNEQVAVEAMKLGAYDYLRKEEIDVQHLATVIDATRERHMFRIAREMEEERTKEIILNKEATEKVRRTINILTPALNSAFAGIAAELDASLGKILETLPQGPETTKLRAALEEIRRQMGVLESGMAGLLDLYQFVYAHHGMMPEIEEMKKRFEEKIQQSLERKSA